MQAGDRRPRSVVARAEMPITWDDRGVSGVPVGARAPQMWGWARIDEIVVARPPGGPTSTADRLALRIDVPDARDPNEPAVAWLAFGPDQQPREVEMALRRAWRAAKTRRSPLSNLSIEDRTRRLAADLSIEPIRVPSVAGSPELLYQEIRSKLLATRSLRPIRDEAELDELLDSFDELLDANDMHGLTRSEVRDLEADGTGSRPAVYRSLDAIAEQRGGRMVIIDHGGPDHLIGLIPADRADDWDGQEVGDAPHRILLHLPEG